MNFRNCCNFLILVGFGYFIIVEIFFGLVEILVFEMICLRYEIDCLKSLYLEGFSFNLWFVNF